MDNSALNTPLDNNDKSLHFGLEKIDEAIKNYLQDKIYITQNNVRIKVPIFYGSAELWYQVKRNKLIRDRNNQLFAPIIIYKRTGITKNKNIMRNIDFNSPNMYIPFYKRYSKHNFFRNYELNPQYKKSIEIFKLIVPTYLDISYDFFVWTYYQTQMNEIIEIISDMDGAYWGDMKTYRFLVLLDSFSDSVEVSEGQNRMVKMNFSITLKGFIIPEHRFRIAKEYNIYTPITVNVSEQVMTDEQVINELETKYYENEKELPYFVEVPKEIKESNFIPIEQQVKKEKNNSTTNITKEKTDIIKEFYKKKNIL